LLVLLSFIAIVLNYNLLVICSLLCVWFR